MNLPSDDILRAALPDVDSTRAAFLRKPFRYHAVLEALRVARQAPRFATPNLARHFRQARSLGSKDRKIVQDAVFDIIRHEGFLRLTGATDDNSLLTALLAWLEGERFPSVQATEPNADFATALSLPVEIAAEWWRELGPAEAVQFAAHQARRAPTVLRPNRQRCTALRLQQRLLDEGIHTTPHPWVADALVVDQRAAFPTSRAFQDGWFEVQDAASQAFVAAIPLEPDTEVLDLCAGAGGKSLALAARGARVTAWDVRPAALRELEKRATRARTAIRIQPPAPADVVVIDAPCSGTGRLRREPALRWKLDPSEFLAVQQSLLEDALDWVRPSGLLAYATCSLLQAENQPHLSARLRSEFALVETRVLWPHQHHTDGFGWSIWRRCR